MSKLIRLSQLSPARQSLVRLCQMLDFGQIQCLRVQDADPTFRPPPLILADLHLLNDAARRPETALQDFELRAEVQRLMMVLDEIQNGTITRIDVHRGLPRRVLFACHWPDGLL